MDHWGSLTGVDNPGFGVNRGASRLRGQAESVRIRPCQRCRLDESSSEFSHLGRDHRMGKISEAIPSRDVKERQFFTRPKWRRD